MVTPTGEFSTLYNFCSVTNCADGANPEAQLTVGSDGNLYGTTTFGGGAPECSLGCGTIFRFSNGTLTTLHAFMDNINGSIPQPGLVQDVNGDFYGTTLEGGADNYGTIFAISPSGKFKKLLDFDFNNGEASTAPVQSTKSSSLYGATNNGGAFASGEVYEVNSSGIRVLYSFPSTAEQNNPISGLSYGRNGLLYGLTGSGINYGTFYSITTGGSLTTLYNFTLESGTDPISLPALVLGPDGNFYGTARGGGLYGGGTIFSLTPAGVIEVPHNFAGSDGSSPVSGLTEATDGSFYGDAYQGGLNGEGTVFHISTGLPAFVQPVPGFGAIGTNLIILGPNLTGTTSVSFNGVTASFTVVSRTEITVTIPIGATSGPLKIVTPAGTLSTKLAFRVLD
jgi:uncharacterized repeat protein (TIGR03803 family)